MSKMRVLGKKTRGGRQTPPPLAFLGLRETYVTAEGKSVCWEGVGMSVVICVVSNIGRVTNILVSSFWHISENNEDIFTYLHIYIVPKFPLNYINKNNNRVIHTGWDFRDDCKEFMLICFILFGFSTTVNLCLFLLNHLLNHLKTVFKTYIKNYHILRVLGRLYSQILHG